MDDVEKRISASVQTLSGSIERTLITLIRIALLPITLPLRLLKLSIPPALHVTILVSLLPLLGLFSISAGVLVSRWLPRGWSQPLFLQYGEAPFPYAYTTLKDLASNQQYDISVHLVVPRSQPNYDLGNFMTSVTLTTMNNRTVSQSQRPSLLIPPMLPMRLISTSALTTVTVPLFQSFVPGYSTLRARVEVGRPDGWTQLGNGQGRELAVVEAYIKGNVKLSGLTALLAVSPLTTSIATAVVFFFTAAFIALGLYFAYSPSFNATPPDDDGPGTVATKASPERELKPALRRRRSSTVEVKTEAEGSREQPLRRRRSTLSERSPSVGSSTRRIRVDAS